MKLFVSFVECYVLEYDKRFSEFTINCKNLEAYVYSYSKLDMCLWNTDAPSSNKVKLWQKSQSHTLWPRPTPQGHGISVKCEEPIDELTVQVWLLDFVSGTELWTDGQTNRQTGGQTDG